MHNVLFFQFFFSLEFSFFVGAHGVVFLLTFLLYWYLWNLFLQSPNYIFGIHILFLGQLFKQGKAGLWLQPLEQKFAAKKGLNTCQYETNQQTSESNTIVASAASGHVFH